MDQNHLGRYSIKLMPEGKDGNYTTVCYVHHAWKDFAMITLPGSAEPVHLWDVTNDVNGLCGKEVAIRSFNALLMLSNLGINNSDPNYIAPIWPSGLVDCMDGSSYPMDTVDRLRVLCLHLRRIMVIGLANPTLRFSVA